MLPTFLIVSLIIRLLGFFTPALWYDEAVSKYRATLPFAQYLTDTADYNGANAWEVLLRPFAAGPVWLLRLPALLCALLALWLCWKLMEAWGFAQHQQRTAAVGLALLPGLLWLAQDARYYSALGALYLGALWFGTQRRPLGLLACAGLLPYIHPVGGAYAAAALLIALRWLPFRRVTALGGLAALSWMPYYYRMVFMQRGQFWLEQVSPAWAFYQTVQALFVNTLTWQWGIFALVLLLVILSLGGLAIRRDSGLLTFAAATLPAVFMLVVSIWKPVYFYRPAGPLAYPLLMLAGLTLAPTRKWYSWILPGLAGLVLLVGLVNYDPAARGGYIDQAAATIRANWQSGDRIIYVSATTAYPFVYYLPDLDYCLFAGSADPSLTPYNPGHAACEELPATSPGRTWLVWPRSPLFGPETTRLLTEYTTGLRPLYTTSAWHFAPIEVYLK